MSPALEFTGTYDAAQRNFDALAASQPVTVTSLPTSAPDGQVVFFVADSTNGVSWHLKYNAGSSSSYKWQFVGGPALHVTVDTQEATTSTTLTTLTTAGPTITVPLAGDYDVEVGANGWHSAADGHVYMGFQVGAAAASFNDATEGTSTTATGAVQLPPVPRRVTGIAAGTTIASRYAGTTGTSTFRRRWMRVTPVRVG